MSGCINIHLTINESIFNQWSLKYDLVEAHDWSVTF